MIFSKNKILYKTWIIDWLYEKKHYIKTSTYSSYSNNIYNHIIPSLGNLYLNEITHKTIQDFILKLADKGRSDNTGGLSEKTIKDITIIVKSSISKAIRENIIKYIDLTFKYPKKTSKKDIYILTSYEQNKLTNYVINNLNHKNLGILISLYTGIRIGELCALKWEDINFKKSILKINKTAQRIYIKSENNTESIIIIDTPKTNNAIREIPINKTLLEILKKLKSKSNYYILTNSTKVLEPRAYRKHFNSVLKKSKMKHFKFHSLRHTFATNCITLGNDYKTVSEILGHANISITLNLYVHPRLSQKKKCINTVCKVFEEKYNKRISEIENNGS